jgi:hypothetical protein
MRSELGRQVGFIVHLRGLGIWEERPLVGRDGSRYRDHCFFREPVRLQRLRDSLDVQVALIDGAQRQE